MTKLESLSKTAAPFVAKKKKTPKSGKSISSAKAKKKVKPQVLAATSATSTSNTPQSFFNPYGVIDTTGYSPQSISDAEALAADLTLGDEAMSATTAKGEDMSTQEFKQLMDHYTDSTTTAHQRSEVFTYLQDLGTSSALKSAMEDIAGDQFGTVTLNGVTHTYAPNELKLGEALLKLKDSNATFANNLMMWQEDVKADPDASQGLTTLLKIGTGIGYANPEATIDTDLPGAKKNLAAVEAEITAYEQAAKKAGSAIEWASGTTGDFTGTAAQQTAKLDPFSGASNTEINVLPDQAAGNLWTKYFLGTTGAKDIAYAEAYNTALYAGIHGTVSKALSGDLISFAQEAEQQNKMAQDAGQGDDSFSTGGAYNTFLGIEANQAYQIAKTKYSSGLEAGIDILKLNQSNKIGWEEAQGGAVAAAAGEGVLVNVLAAAKTAGESGGTWETREWAHMVSMLASGAAGVNTDETIMKTAQDMQKAWNTLLTKGYGKWSAKDSTGPLINSAYPSLDQDKAINIYDGAPTTVTVDGKKIPVAEAMAQQESTFWGDVAALTSAAEGAAKPIEAAGTAQRAAEGSTASALSSTGYLETALPENMINRYAVLASNAQKMWDDATITANKDLISKVTTASGHAKSNRSAEKSKATTEIAIDSAGAAASLATAAATSALFWLGIPEAAAGMAAYQTYKAVHAKQEETSWLAKQTTYLKHLAELGAQEWTIIQNAFPTLIAGTYAAWEKTQS